MDRTFRAAVLVIVVCAAGDAGGQVSTPLLGGKSARLVDKPGTASDGAKVVFARDAALAFPPNPLCPATSTLELSSPDEQPGPIALPCAGWKASGSGFVYNDKLGSAGGVRKVLLKAGKLSVTAKGGTYRPITGPISSLDVRLDVAGQQYCGRFVTVPKNVAGNMRAKGPTVACDAGAPGSGGDLTIDTPADGAFVNPGVVRVTGRVRNVAPGAVATVRLNGTLATLDMASGGWAADVVVAPGSIANPLLAELTVDGQRRARRRITLLVGASLPEGTPVPHGIGIAAGAALFPDHIDGALLSLAAAGLTQVLDGLEATGIGGIEIRNASYSGLTARVRPDTGRIDVVLDVAQATLDYKKALPLQPDCHGRATASGLHFQASFDQSPDVVPSRIDLTLLANPSVQIADVDIDPSGFCLPDIYLELFLPDNLAGRLEPPLNAALGDPDGAGPQESPIADALENALAGLDVSGPVGTALGVTLDARFADIVESPAAVVYDVDASVTASQVAVGAPDLVASYYQPGVLPSIGSTTPGGQSYDLALFLSTSVLNQLAKAKVESGVLNVTATAVGGQALTAGLLAQLVPAFGTLPPSTPLTLHIRPTVAPIVTAGDAPPGALAAVRLANLTIDILDAASSATLLALALDARLGVSLQVDATGGQLLPHVTTPAPGDVTAVVLGGTLSVGDAEIGGLVPSLVGAVLPGLVGALGPVRLPSIAGLPRIYPVEVTSVGEYVAAFIDFNDPPSFVEPATDLFVTIALGDILDLRVVAQDGESDPADLSVDVFSLPPGPSSFFLDPTVPGSRSLIGFFSYSADGVGPGSVSFVVTDADGVVAVRNVQILVCRDPNDPTSCLF